MNLSTLDDEVRVVVDVVSGDGVVVSLVVELATLSVDEDDALVLAALGLASSTSKQ